MASDDHVSQPAGRIDHTDTTNGLEPVTIEQLEAAVMTLRASDRAIFLAHWVDAMTYRPIADSTGLSIRRIETVMARAIADLDRALCGQAPRCRWR